MLGSSTHRCLGTNGLAFYEERLRLHAHLLESKSSSFPSAFACFSWSIEGGSVQRKREARAGPSALAVCGSGGLKGGVSSFHSQLSRDNRAAALEQSLLARPSFLLLEGMPRRRRRPSWPLDRQSTTGAASRTGAGPARLAKPSRPAVPSTCLEEGAGGGGRGQTLQPPLQKVAAPSLARLGFAAAACCCCCCWGGCGSFPAAQEEPRASRV